MKLTRKHVRGGAASIVAVCGIVVGVAAPALAGSRNDTIDNRLDGWASANWSDHDSDDETRVTVDWCTREFQARIRRNRTALPDVTEASEWINCQSYVDAVRTGSYHPPAATYHYDINGMDAHYGCPELNGFCNYRTTAGVRVYW